MMRPILLALVLSSSVAVAAQSIPEMLALRGFTPGAWQVKPIGGQSSSSHCLQSAAPMLMGERPGEECSFTVISDGPDGATLTYRCAGGRSGRTSVRRDTKGIFTVDAQGLEGGKPFQSRSEWRRTGAC
jgi:hypothetical protein